MGVLYWSACSLPSEDAVEGLRAYLDATFSHEANRSYLDALMGHADRRPLPRVIIPRLCGLSLLPPLLERAGVDPASVLLCRDEHGRPHGEIEGEGVLPFDFNMSHSDGHAACALLPGGGTVGLDMEELLTPKRALPLIAHYCTAGESATLEGLTDREKAAAFTRLWTVREALCKQDGRGMPLRYDAAGIPDHVKVFCGVFPDTETRISLCVPMDIGISDVIAVPPAPRVDWVEWMAK